jgi:DNA-binding transcriptional LysR family regulator
VGGPLIADDPNVAIRATVDGVGIAYVIDVQAKRAMARRRLVRVLEAWCPPFPGLYPYHPRQAQVPPPLRAFVEFLREKGRSIDQTGTEKSR